MEEADVLLVLAAVRVLVRWEFEGTMPDTTPLRMRMGTMTAANQRENRKDCKVSTQASGLQVARVVQLRSGDL